MKNLWVGLTVLVTASMVWAQSPKILSYVKVHDEKQIALSDIIEINQAKPLLRDKLQTTVLGDGPSLGEQRIFTSRAVAQIIREKFPELKGIKIPNQILIENRGYELNKNKIKTTLEARWQKLCAECKFIFRSISLPILPTTAVGKRWRVEEQGRLPRGSFSRKIQIFQDQGAPMVYWVSGQVEIHRKVPVATRAIDMGESLRAEDVELKLRDVTFATDGFPALKEIVGLKTRRGLRANDVIWHAYVEREKALKRGDTVKVITGSSGWELNLIAVAEQDGYVGDTVKVRNRNT